MQENTEKVKVEIYKEDSTIKLELPVAYVLRFNEMLMNFIPFENQEHMFKVLDNVANGKIEDNFTYHVATLLSFLTLVEDSAREQNLLKKVEYDPITKEKTEIEE